MTLAAPAAEKAWVPLTPRERRVVGVLVEKQKTTPEYYPMSVAALVTGSNQKSNRDPVTNYDVDDVEDILQGLRKKGAAVQVEGSGRVVKWKHTLYDWLDLRNRPAELAVVAELLLRGPQTEGDLRARASRMDPIPDLPALQAILDTLTARGLVVPLTPAGVRRGVVVTHTLYPPEEMERVRQAHATAGLAAPEPEEPRGMARPPLATAPPAWEAEMATLREDVATLRRTVDTLAAEIQALKTALGA